MADFNDILKSLASDAQTIQASGEELTTVSASALDISQNGIQIKFDSNVQAASTVTSENRHPIQGVLFRVDEPSESAPSVGLGSRFTSLVL